MNWIRRIRPCLRALGLWIALGVVDPQVRAEGLAETPPSPPPTAEADSTKVRGTITVDFDKVTISELLKLVSAVEKVDGSIRIVSSHPREGEEAIEVSGGRGAVSLAGVSSPSSPKMTITAANPIAPPLAPVHSPADHATAASPEFPRLTAIARLLGMGKKAEPADFARTAAAHALAQKRSPGVAPLSPAPANIPSLSSSVPNVGSRIEALAVGEPLIVGRVHSPWPASEDVQNSDVRPDSKRDHSVNRTSLGDQTNASSADPQRYVATAGDTFETLAKKHYGDARYASALWWANRNRVTWPEALTAGKAILIPGLGQLEPRMVMARPTSKSDRLPPLESIGPRRDPATILASFTGESASPSNPTATGLGGFAVHVVRPNDTLRIIAREKCGDERKALEIIALNRDALSREGRPRVGQCLILPAPAASPSPAK